jgi:hypothetical protein
MEDRQAFANGGAPGNSSGRQVSLHSDLERQVTDVTSMWRKEKLVVRDDASGEDMYPGQLEQLIARNRSQCSACENSKPKSSYGHSKKATKPKRRQHLRAPKATDRAGRARLASKGVEIPLQVKSACSECRRRKQRCSGERPACQFCNHRELICSYEVADGLTRGEDLKRRLREAICRADNLEKILKAMQCGTSEDSTMLLAKMRLGAPIEELLFTASRVHNLPIVAKLEP